MTPFHAVEVLANAYEALQRLAAIANAYDHSGLDEHRPEWGERPPEEVVLVSGRGGGTLLTLADAFAARRMLQAYPPQKAGV